MSRPSSEQSSQRQKPQQKQSKKNKTGIKKQTPSKNGIKQIRHTLSSSQRTHTRWRHPHGGRFPASWVLLDVDPSFGATLPS
jgi:hypothetical protein